MIIKKYQVNEDNSLDFYNIIIEGLGTTGFRRYIFDNPFDNIKDRYVYLCYDNETLLGYGIISYYPDGIKDFYHIPKVKFDLSYMLVKETQRKSGIGKYLLNHIIEDINEDIYLHSINETYMFYIRYGAYVMDTNFVDTSTMMVIPSKRNRDIPIDQYLRNIMTGVFTDMYVGENKFIESSISITKFYIQEYYCNTCTKWKRYIEDLECLICPCIPLTII